jgi:hypothetical protein
VKSERERKRERVRERKREREWTANQVEVGYTEAAVGNIHVLLQVRVARRVQPQESNASIILANYN